MKKLSLTIGILIGFIILSCSSDDDSGNQQNDNQNGFEIDNVFFSTSIVYLNDENPDNINPSDLAIILTNRDLLQNNSIDSGINFVYIDYNGIDFEVGSKTILDYRIIENASFNGTTVENGNIILDDSFESGFNATESSLIINSISSTSIDLDFSFTREDGKIISGNYSGNFTDINN